MQSSLPGLHRFADHLCNQLRQQQARRGKVVIRVLLDQGARRQDQRLLHIGLRDTVVQVLQRLLQDALRRDALA